MLPRRLSSLVLGLCAAFATTLFTLSATGADGDHGSSAEPGDRAAATAVRALKQGSPAEALATVPDDFARLRGYRPEVVDGLLVRADGGCSSPVALPEAFEPACRQHDYGYDLLRYAEQTGEPLGRWARGAIDDQFADRVRGLCHDVTDMERADRCRVAAEVAVAGVEFNSVRQGDGVPEESVLTQAALASAVVGALGVMGAAVPSRRRTW